MDINKSVFSALGSRYVLKERNMHDLAEIKKGIYRFTCKAYVIEGVGNLFLLDGAAMFGAMRLQTCVITPEKKDLSFCNFDTVNAMGKFTGLFEMYKSSLKEADLSVFDEVKAEYKDLPDYKAGSGWADSWKLPSCIGKQGKKIEDRTEKMLMDCLVRYMDLLESAPECDLKAKEVETWKYVSKLLSEGGPAVDKMKEILGKEAAAKLVRKYMFGIGD